MKWSPPTSHSCIDVTDVTVYVTGMGEYHTHQISFLLFLSSYRIRFPWLLVTHISLCKFSLTLTYFPCFFSSPIPDASAFPTETVFGMQCTNEKYTQETILTLALKVLVAWLYSSHFHPFLFFPLFSRPLLCISFSFLRISSSFLYFNLLSS